MELPFDPTCGTCFWFHGPGEEATGGTCWRYPPVPVSIPVPAPKPALAVPVDRKGGEGAAPGGLMTFPVRPPVTENTHACGEWDNEANDARDDGEDVTPGDGT